MKKALTLLTIFMLLSSFVLAAPPVPKPIRGYFTINGHGVAGYIIEVTNTRTGEVISGDNFQQLVTETNGFAFDLGFFSQGYAGPIEGVYGGDVIKVKARGFADEINFNVPSQTPYEISIAITSGAPIVQCADGSFVADISLCPEIEEPEPEEPEVVVEVETKVSSSEDKSSASVEADYGQEIDVQVTNTKLDSLKDGTIDFDGEDYDFREIIYFDGIVETSIVEEDYGLNPYLVLQEGALEYRYKFDDLIDLSEIEEDEELEITFLGKDIKIIEAWDDEITVRSGTEDTISEGKGIKIDGKSIIIKSVAQSSVDIDVDGVNQIISEGNSREVNGIHILVEDIHYKGYDSEIKSAVTIVAGTQADKTVRNGDDFELFVEDDDTFKWVISLPNYIGVVSQEEYSSVDEDEEFKPLGIGDSFSLPNNYVNVKFSSITETPRTEITFKVKDNQLLVKGDDGDFVSPTDEYDRVYIDSTGIYDDDDVLIATDKIRLGDSDTYLELGSVKIGLLTIKLDMSDILYDGISYLNEDGNFLDYLGIIFSDPENGVEDQSGFEVSIPEERPEATITFSQGEIDDEDVVVIPPDDVIVTPPDVIPPDDDVIVTPPVVTPPVIEPPVIIPPIVPLVEPESKVFEALIGLLAIILAALGVKWRAGFLGMAKWQWNKGNKLTAIKMLLTATKRAKEDYYKKKG